MAASEPTSFKTPRQEWAVLAGLAATREDFATQDTSESLEAVIGTGFFEVSLYGSYDTDADATADSKSDYGMTTSLGYSF